MKMMTRPLPTANDSMPWRIEARPSDGPTVRSSAIVTGAGIAAARSTIVCPRARARQRLAALGLAQAARILTPEDAFHRLVLGEKLELQNRRLADDPLGALGVRLTRQLYEDRIAATALNERLGQTELIDAI